MALKVFSFQYDQNPIYRTYVDAIGVRPQAVDGLEKIPFLPISFFKTHKVTTTEFDPETVFESSGTTGTNTSRHWLKTTDLYKKSFLKAFHLFYGNPMEWCILGLLPGYLERENSSLVYMVDTLARISRERGSGFYLHNHDQLYQTLVRNEIARQPTLLIGVTYALLDFTENHSMKLHNTIVMETGGMKGKREEIIREEVHRRIRDQLGVGEVHSEYGMTELLSQAYSKGNGRYRCPPWMRVLVREYNDPFAVTARGDGPGPVSGLLNVIDLANVFSCSFIATDDVGKLYRDGGFEVMGRRDSSDLRGCSLLTV